MLAIIFSDWYYGVGKLYKSDGTPYRTAHGAFRNHPCTQWAAASQYNLAWLIRHGYALCDEYNQRYGKVHTCFDVIVQAERIFHRSFSHINSLSQASRRVVDFTRAMPESIKFDTTIDTITAYKRYLNTKPWLASNYLRIPSRKPSFIITTMTQSKPVYDFSTTPEQRKAEQAKQDAAIAAAQVAKLEKSMQDAPAVRTIKSKASGLVPAKKPAAKKSGKAGRIVGISKDENEFIQEVLHMIADDPELGASNPNYVKIQARYNK
tara:strand:- start:2517 stop:3308 length:792 start_codon:yes stop_codon:yes gene_type:complete